MLYCVYLKNFPIMCCLFAPVRPSLFYYAVRPPLFYYCIVNYVQSTNVVLMGRGLYIDHLLTKPHDNIRQGPLY